MHVQLGIIAPLDYSIAKTEIQKHYEKPGQSAIVAYIRECCVDRLKSQPEAVIRLHTHLFLCDESRVIAVCKHRSWYEIIDIGVLPH